MKTTLNPGDRVKFKGFPDFHPKATIEKSYFVAGREKVTLKEFTGVYDAALLEKIKKEEK